MWNESDALTHRVNSLENVSTALKVIQAVSGTVAILQAIKVLDLGQVPFGTITIVTLPLQHVVDAFLKKESYQNWAEQCHNIAAEYDALQVQTRFFRENRLPYCDLNDADSRVEELQQRRLDINRRRPSALFDQNSWVRARDGVNEGESTYAIDKASLPTSSSQ